MRWEAWVLIALYVVSSLTNIATIGRRREPTTPGDVCIGTIVTAVLVWLVLRLAGVA